ncbi:MAG: nuclear transport factor 2 family protein [Bacteroidota bacterium]
MKTLKFFLLGCVLLFSVKLKAQDTSTQLIKLMDEAAIAWTKGDLDSYMALYSPKATMMMPEGRAGLKSIRELYEKYYFEEGKVKQPLSYANYEITMLGKDNALLTGIFILKATDKLKERKGTFTVIFTREKDDWKILHDHSG